LIKILFRSSPYIKPYFAKILGKGEKLMRIKGGDILWTFMGQDPKKPLPMFIPLICLLKA